MTGTEAAILQERHERWARRLGRSMLLFGLAITLFMTFPIVGALGAILQGSSSTLRKDPLLLSCTGLISLIIPVSMVAHVWLASLRTAVSATGGTRDQPLVTLPLHPSERATVAGLRAWLGSVPGFLLFGFLSFHFMPANWARSLGSWEERLLFVLACLGSLLPAYLAGGFNEGTWHDGRLASYPRKAFALLLAAIAPLMALLSVHWSPGLGIAWVLVTCGVVLSGGRGLSVAPSRLLRRFTERLASWRKTSTPRLSRPWLPARAALKRDAWPQWRTEGSILLGLLPALWFFPALLDDLGWAAGLSMSVLPFALVPSARAFATLFSSSPPIDTSLATVPGSPWERIPMEASAVAQTLHRQAWSWTAYAGILLSLVLFRTWLRHEDLRAAEALAFLALSGLLVHLSAWRMSRYDRTFRPGQVLMVPLIAALPFVLAIWCYHHEGYSHRHAFSSFASPIPGMALFLAWCLAVLWFAASHRKSKDAPYLLLAGLVPALLQCNVLVVWPSGLQPWVTGALLLLGVTLLPTLYRMGLEIQIQSVATAERQPALRPVP